MASVLTELTRGVLADGPRLRLSLPKTSIGALATLNAEVFAADALQISPELVRLLAPDRWRHWGQTLTIYPLDYPIYNRILLVQALALSDVLNGRAFSEVTGR